MRILRIERASALFRARHGLSRATRGLQNLFFKHWSRAAGTSLFDFSHPSTVACVRSIVTMSLWLVWNVWQRQISTKRSSPSWAKWKRCDLAREDSPIPKRPWFGIIMLCYRYLSWTFGSECSAAPIQPQLVCRTCLKWPSFVWKSTCISPVPWSKLANRGSSKSRQRFETCGLVPHHWLSTTATGHHPQTLCKCGLEHFPALCSTPSRYSPLLPYHTAIHAADVMMTMETCFSCWGCRVWHPYGPLLMFHNCWPFLTTA